MLHKHCNLNKWQIWEYTLPQITELIKCTSRYIQFEVEIRMAPFSTLAGGVSEESTSSNITNDDDEYREMTEDDVLELARILGGG